MALSTNINFSLISTLTGSQDLSSVVDRINYSKTLSLSSGTGANQADQLWSDQRTLAASTTEDLDLSGTLTNSLGTTVAFARVKAIVVYAAAGNTNNVLVGGAASAQFINWVGDATDLITVRPGGLFVLTAPDATAFAVTATTGDLLKIANSGAGTGVTYDIILIGATA